jgi:hypothetical protein
MHDARIVLLNLKFDEDGDEIASLVRIHRAVRCCYALDVLQSAIDVSDMHSRRCVV